MELQIAGIGRRAERQKGGTAEEAKDDEIKRLKEEIEEKDKEIEKLKSGEK